MRSKLISGLFPLLMIVSITSCSDFFEKDISRDTIKLVSPSDSGSSVILTQVFTWEEVDKALSYQLQIVTPDFNLINRFIADTVLTDTRFEITLQPGKYEWRVKAMNGSSETNYTTYSLTVDTTSDLSSQVIMVNAPINLSYSNAFSNNFVWSPIYSATSYNVQLAQNNYSATSNIFLDTIVNTPYAYLEVLVEGSFQMRVKAINLRGSSAFSTPVTFYVDVTSPQVPGLLIPVNNGSMSNPVNFYWDNGVASGSPVTDSIYIYSDSLATMVRCNGYSSSSSHRDSLPAGTYYWRVKSWDAAGNYSLYSTTRKVTVN